MTIRAPQIIPTPCEDQQRRQHMSAHTAAGRPIQGPLRQRPVAAGSLAASRPSPLAMPTTLLVRLASYWRDREQAETERLAAANTAL
jgi:hypothetical protein